MKIALSTMVLDPASRSANMARVLRLIDKAAQSDPVPDMIVVPSGCDRTCESDGFFSPAMSEAYWASLSAKAREWGVYLAAGQHRFMADSVQEVATLFDADGDEILLHRVDAPPVGLTTGDTLVGSIGLCFESECMGAGRTVTRSSPMPEVIVVFGDPENGSGRGSGGGNLCQELGLQADAFVCLVRASAQLNKGGDCIRCSPASCVQKRLELAGGWIVTVALPASEQVESPGAD